jgi:hypothetical protein
MQGEQERLAHCVLGAFGVAQHAVAERQERALVPRQQLLQRRARSPERPARSSADSAARSSTSPTVSHSRMLTMRPSFIRVQMIRSHAGQNQSLFRRRVRR